MGSRHPLPAPSGVAPGGTGTGGRVRIIDDYGVDDVATSAPLPRIQVLEDDDESSDEDFRQDEGGGKKRKGASIVSASSHASNAGGGGGGGGADSQPKIRQSQLKVGNVMIPIFPPAYPRDHSRAYRIGLWQRNRFLRRKAALITLYLDAQAIILAGSVKLAPKPNFPDVPAFEKLLPALEYVNVGEWAPDNMGWRDAPDDPANAARVARQPRRDAWRTNLAKRKREREARKPVVRGGWAPEGSFEFECECKTSGASRSTIKDRAALQKLILDLKAIVLSSPTLPPPLTEMMADETEPSKTRRRIDRAKNAASAATKSQARAQSATHKASEQPSNPADRSDPQTQPMSKTPSMGTTDSKETNLQTPPTPSIAPPGAKKKPKKKKRSVMANQGNPHHVDNYRSNRVATPQIDPYEPYPSHANMLFPPPMKFLSARPQRKTAPLPGQPAPAPIRPSEDEFTCCFCYYALYFGSEKLRKWAIRERRREIKRKDAIKQKAKNVAEGKGMKDEEQEEDDYDDDEDDDYSCEDDDDHDERCTCGRAINRRKARKPPDRDDPPTPAQSILDVDSLD